MFRLKTKVDSQAESPIFALDTATPLAAESPAVRGFRLEPGVPNPFNTSTAIFFTLPEQGDVDLRVLDPSGRVVQLLAASQRFPSGRHQLVWNGDDRHGRPVTAGTYFIQLRSGPRSATQRLSLVR